MPGTTSYFYRLNKYVVVNGILVEQVEANMVHV